MGDTEDEPKPETSPEEPADAPAPSPEESPDAPPPEEPGDAPASPPTDDGAGKKEEGKEGGTKKGGKLVLTPSEKALGIKITQPKQKMLTSMNRLYAVPSEKLRVWTCWLTKVGERADEWQWWLRAQISLAMRMSDLLQAAQDAIEAEEKAATEEKAGEEKVETVTELEVKEIEEKPEESPTADVEPEKEEPEKEAEEPPTADVEPEKEAKGDDQAEEVKEEAQPAEETTDPPAADEASPPPPPPPPAEGGDEKDKGKGEGKGKDKGKGKGKKKKVIQYKEGFWPIGEPWKPLSEKNKEELKREPDVIPIPKDEDEMLKFIKQLRHTTVVYRTLYKHWSETADQAIKEIVGREVMKTKKVFLPDEEIPYCFYLEADPDIEYVIDHDDEEVLLPDLDREKITHGFDHLYFNITDKPGKGGKPWL